MRTSGLVKYIVRHYLSNREYRNYGLLLVGPPGIGKSTAVKEAAEILARELDKIFVEIKIRWSPRLKKFVISNHDELPIDAILKEPERFFCFTDMRLSIAEPSDLEGIPRSRGGMTFFEPLAWAVVHSVAEGILFLDESRVSRCSSAVN